MHCNPYFSPDLPSSRASREMPRTPRSAHKALVMQAIRTLQRNASRVPKIEAVSCEVFFISLLLFAFAVYLAAK